MYVHNSPRKIPQQNKPQQQHVQTALGTEVRRAEKALLGLKLNLRTIYPEDKGSLGNRGFRDHSKCRTQILNKHSAEHAHSKFLVGQEQETFGEKFRREPRLALNS